MSRSWPWKGWQALACALVVGGCSASTGDRQAAGREDDVAVHLSPDPASAAMPITVVLADAMLRPDACRFEWRRDGEIVTGAEGASLDPSRFYCLPPARSRRRTPTPRGVGRDFSW